ncbi:hypothetical protein F53441_3443 [Fusarium austroafricanum]|uniref:Uncharacterized protein n=1 Tax=Fusarium austroafricanum TaxID=2364996 RepID=A0A8H4P1S2_9HYPO|nr:hypothetical protein F53441_3443 [Fusarium austroafricanum]
MLRPTDSPKPIGIGFLLLSFGAQFSSAIPYNFYQLNERDVYTDTTTTSNWIPVVGTETNNVVNTPTSGTLVPTTSSDAIINTDTTTHDAIVVDTTTNAAPVAETPTTIGEIVGDTTSAEVPGTVDVFSSTGASVNSAPTTTSNWIPPVGTDASNGPNTPGPDTTTNVVVPPAGTTTNEPVSDTTTNTGIPPAGTETTSNAPGPVDTTTNTDIPVGTETTSNVIQPVDTTTDAPAPGTTTTEAAAPVVDTTTTADIPPPNTDTTVSSAEVPAPQTTTDKADAPSTTAPVNNAPSTTDKASEPSGKPSDAPSAPVTAPPQGTTAAVSQAQVTASEYNSKVDDIIPIIVAWTNNPDGLKTDTLNKVNNLIDGVKGAIKDLGGSESGGCPGKKRRRGLLDLVSNVINTLSCVVSNLEDVTGKITGGIVDGVTPIVSTLTNQSNDLKEQSEEKEEEKSKTDKKESTKEEESKTEESKTEQSTTEKATSTEASTTETTQTTETSTGACSMRETTDLPAASNTQPTTTPPLPPAVGGTAGADETTSSTVETAKTDSPTSAEATTTGNGPETTTAEGPQSTKDVNTSGYDTSTKAAEETSTADETKAGNTETDTSAPATTRPSTLLTTTRPSPDQTSNTITSGSTEVITSADGITTEPTRTYYPCNIFGGPRVATAYCQCSTTISGKQYVTSASMIDNDCAGYTAFPGTINPATEAPPPTQAPIEEPLTKTIDGTVLAWDSYTLAYGNVYTGIKVTFSNGIGPSRTIATPVPTQTHVDNDGGGQCGTSDGLSKSGLGDACDRAINEFNDDTIYTGYTTRYSRSSKGLLMVMSMGQAACIAKFSCDDYGIGMSGKLIKEARENAKKNDNIWMCGHIELSNSCKVVMDYCTNCNNEG